MTLRAIKIALVLGVAIFYSLVVFGNITDYGSNFEFTRHVMMMDTTFPGNHGMWRAVHTPWLYHAFYLSIIAWETVTMILCWWGGFHMAWALRGTAAAFHQSKRITIVALTFGLLMWLVAFLDVAGEWFMMWQSKTWSGQEEAFRMFGVLGIVLLLVVQTDTEGQP